MARSKAHARAWRWPDAGRDARDLAQARCRRRSSEYLSEIDHSCRLALLCVGTSRVRLQVASYSGGLYGHLSLRQISARERVERA
jgi:hypothetical protein